MPRLQIVFVRMRIYKIGFQRRAFTGRGARKPVLRRAGVNAAWESVLHDVASFCKCASRVRGQNPCASATHRCRPRLTKSNQTFLTSSPCILLVSKCGASFNLRQRFPEGQASPEIHPRTGSLRCWRWSTLHGQFGKPEGHAVQFQ
jgi:hypothetical protein